MECPPGVRQGVLGSCLRGGSPAKVGTFQMQVLVIHHSSFEKVPSLGRRRGHGKRAGGTRVVSVFVCFGGGLAFFGVYGESTRQTDDEHDVFATHCGFSQRIDSAADAWEASMANSSNQVTESVRPQVVSADFQGPKPSRRPATTTVRTGVASVRALPSKKEQIKKLPPPKREELDLSLPTRR